MNHKILIGDLELELNIVGNFNKNVECKNYFEIREEFECNRVDALERLNKKYDLNRKNSISTKNLSFHKLDAQVSTYSYLMLMLDLLFYKYHGHDKFGFLVFLPEKENYEGHLFQPKEFNSEDTIHEIIKGYEFSQITKFQNLNLEPLIYKAGVMFLDSQEFCKYSWNLDSFEMEVIFVFLMNEKEIKLQILYSSDYEMEMIDQMGNHLYKIHDYLTKEQNRKIQDIKFENLSINEFGERQIEFRDTIIKKFERNVKDYGSKPAYIYNNKTVTYKKLQQKVNQLCNYLQNQYPNNRQLKLGLYCKRTDNTILCIIAALKSGGMYIPIDKDLPMEKAKNLIQIAGINVLICDESNQFIEVEEQIKKIVDNEIENKIQNENTIFKNRNLSIEDDMCMLYTSGTTGEPKAVIHNQISVVNTIKWYEDECEFTNKDVIAQRSQIQHIPSTIEIFMGLLNGLTTIIIPDEVVIDPDAFLELIMNRKITWLQVVPTLIHMVLLSRNISDFPVKYLVTLGEELTVVTYNQILEKYPNISVYNNYGLTEANTILMNNVEKNHEKNCKKISLGKAIYNTRVAIVNDNFEIVPKGIWGQIVVSGYEFPKKILNTKPDNNPIKYFDELETKILLTGDYGSYKRNSDLIEYIGRKDYIHKIKGKRVDLSLVEEQIQVFEGTKECAVMVHENSDSIKVLVAFVVFNNSKITINQLRKYLKSELESYMIPGEFFVVNQIEKTKTGKINRNELEIQYEFIKSMENKNAKTLDSNEILNRILTDLKSSMCLEQIPDKTITFEEIGMDSLQIMEFSDCLSQSFHIDVRVSDIYNNPSIDEMFHFISNHKKVQSQEENVTKNQEKQVVVIGVSGIFPGNIEVNEFWEKLCNGESMIDDFPEQRKLEIGLDRADELIRGGYLKEVDKFDPLFFKISPREAELMDVQQRYSLMYVWKLLEDAGYAPHTLKKQEVGVFIGTGDSQYLDQYSKEEYTEYTKMGNDSSMIPAKISYFFDFKGPSIALNTACSSSMSAIYYAYNCILNGDSDYAIAGGVHMITSKKFFIETQSLGMLTSENDCYPFDDRSKGIVPGEAAGFVLLKRLDKAIEDKDNIYAVIKGMTINQDGKSNGITAPNGNAQEKLARKNFERHQIAPEDITYVEAHGTGTKLGDPIEFDALSKVYSLSNKKNYCALGSVKANIGHTIAASGICGFIKSILCLKNTKLVPQIKFQNPNNLINFKDSPFYINKKLVSVDSASQTMISLNSFGYSGTNVNAILQGYPQMQEKQSEGNGVFLIPISAKNEKSLYEYVVELYEYVKKKNYQNQNLLQISYVLQTGRNHFKEARKVFIVKSIDDLLFQFDRFITNYKSKEFEDGNKKEEIFIDLPELELKPSIKKKVSEYEAGIDVNWSSMYKHKIQKISLPTYKFKNERYWYKSAVDQKEKSHKIVISKQESTVCNHTILGAKVMPAANYISILKKIYKNEHRNELFGLKNIYFLNLIQLKDKDAILNVKMKIEGGKKNIIVYNEENNVVVRGEIEQESIPQINPNWDFQLDERQYLQEEVYQYYQNLGIKYESKFCMCEKLSLFKKDHKEYGYAILKKREYKEKPFLELDDNTEETFVIDAAMHSMNAILNHFELKNKIPYYIESIQFYQKLWEKDLIVIGVKTKNGINIDIYNKNRVLKAQIKSLVLIELGDETSIFKTNWHVKEPKDKLDLKSNIMFDLGICDSIDSFKGFNSPYMENAKIYQNADELEIQQIGKAVNFIYLISEKRKYDNYYDSFLELFLLIKRMKQADVFQLNLLLVIPINSDFNYILNSSLVSLLGVMNKEMPNYRFKVIEAENQIIDFSLASVIDIEIKDGFTNKQIRYEVGLIRKECILEKSTVIKSNQRLEENGTYLIIGGCGGIGKIISSFLVKKYQANLILVGTKKINDDILGFIDTLKSKGNEVKYMQTDFCDFKEVLEKIDPIKIEIDGVINCAGIIRDNLLIKKNEYEMLEVLKIKMLSSINAFRLFQNSNLKFMALFSSASAEIYQIGQGDYAYANKFVSNFARFVNSNFHVISIAWGYWKNGGMTMNQYYKNKLKDDGMNQITDEKGCEILEKLINSEEKDVTII